MSDRFSISLFLDKTRNGSPLSVGEIQEFVKNIPQLNPEHLTAFLANVYFKSLSAENIASLTHAMKESGRVLNWHGEGRPIVDKHSTGGVGDKITICLAPIVACLDLIMPTISGRGLGFTGGTIDKLEAIPGFSAALPPEKLQKLAMAHGFAFGEQTPDIAPADRILYHFRNLTGYVDALQLIVPSILSKKLAENLNFLILDVKCGSGALMQTLAQARELAGFLVKTAKAAGTKTEALITNMNQPLGEVSGNACEVAEAIACLTKPKGELKFCLDTYELTIELATKMAIGSGKYKEDEARAAIDRALSSGQAYERFCRLIAAQNGDLTGFDNDRQIRPKTKTLCEITSPRAGFVSAIDTRALGQALVLARAGRQKAGDSILNNTYLHHPLKIGDEVSQGQSLCKLGTDDETHGEKIKSLLLNAYEISDTAPRQGLILDVIF